MTYCGDIWITPSTFERNVIAFWRDRPEKFSSYKKATWGYLVHVKRTLAHMEYLDSLRVLKLNRQPVLSDYSS